MAAKFRYKLNPDTLLYEMEKVSAKSRVLRGVFFIVGSLLMVVIVMWFYTSVLGLELPKTALLRRQNASWVSKIERMQKRMDAIESSLDVVAGRDDDVYRNIFGMNPVDPQRRYSGFGGVNRYEYLDEEGASPLLKDAVQRMDRLTKAAYVQSVSFDDVSAISKRAGDMASCVPVSMPMSPDSKYRLSSPFGYRSDPINGQTKFHSGMDFAMDPGVPIYATGDGVVELVNFEIRGYGNQVVINHGFGYKTRYAHLKVALVVEGMKVKRGTLIGECGRSGKATGPHLHYEVFYRGDHVNPINFVDLEMDPKDFKTMVEQASATVGAIPPSQLPGRK